MRRVQKQATVPLVSLLVGLMAVLTEPEKSSGESISYTVGVNNNTQSGMLPLFDPTLGTLTDVTYSASVSVFSTYALTEPQPSISYTSFAVIFLGGPGFEPERFGPPTYHGTIDPAPSPGVLFDISHDFSFSGDLGASDKFVRNIPEIGAINVQVVGAIQVPAQQRNDLGAYGSVTFTYTYASVPEPASLLLAGIAVFLPLSLIVRKRLRQSARRA